MSRRAWCSCTRQARRAACSDAPGVSTRPACGWPMAAAARSHSRTIVRRSRAPPRQALARYARPHTDNGVALLSGSPACVLGKTWGYDDEGVWVADGCSAAFVLTTRPGLVCGSDSSGRQHCDVDTSAGVVLSKTTGTASCVLGESWGTTPPVCGPTGAAAASSSWARPRWARRRIRTSTATPATSSRTAASSRTWPRMTISSRCRTTPPGSDSSSPREGPSSSSPRPSGA